MMNKKFSILISLLTMLYMLTTNLWAKDIVGSWRIIDEQTGVYEADIKIYLNNDKYEGTIENTYSPNGSKKVEKCKLCSGDLKNQPVVGLRVFSGFILNPENQNEFINGSIFDTDTGKTYKATIRLSSNGNKLTIRGYVGISLLGRTQTWIRIRE